MALFTKFLWTELIGFDCTAPDYGTAEFLSRMKIRPEGISLLIWNTELIHSHGDLAKDGFLGASHCAYCGRPCNEEHDRQNWTKFQLRGLVDALHDAGVRVFVSFFDQVVSDVFDWKLEDCSGQWIVSHPEVRSVLAGGRVSSSICRLKHLSDGTLYEDFLIAQLEKFLNDYGFDGLHCADGYSHPRYALCDADFSDDMIGQFMASEKIRVPEGDISSRAEWILHHARLQWIQFHGKRNAEFWRKCLKMLDRHHLGHLFNTCWTRDPFEACFRYGTDYRLLADAGVKNWIVEAQAAVVETEGWNHTGIPMQDQYRTALLRMKALVPEGHFFLLHCIKDGMEQYNVLRHAPAFMESDIYALSQMMHGRQRILEGMMVCLADGISSPEWHRLDALYEKAFAGMPEKLPFPHVLFSEMAMYRELECYVRERQCSSFRLQSGLLSAGASLMGEIAVRNLQSLEPGPLVIINPENFTPEERQSAEKFSRGNLAEIGLTEQGGFSCRIWKNGDLTEDFSGGMIPFPENSGEVSSWLDPLPEALPEKQFLKLAAEKLNRAFCLFQAAQRPESIRLNGYLEKENQLRLFVENEERTYQKAHIRIRGKYTTVRILSADAVLPPSVRYSRGETEVSVKLPPAGTIPMLLIP